MEHQKDDKKTQFHILFQMTLSYQPGFLHNFFIFKQLYKMILFTTVYTSGKKKKQGHCVQGDHKHFGNQTHSPSGVFCLGVYYTRDNTDKDCYIRQGRFQYGAFRTSTQPEDSES
jgi:hypothetical protein